MDSLTHCQTERHYCIPLQETEEFDPNYTGAFIRTCDLKHALIPLHVSKIPKHNKRQFKFVEDFVL